MRLTASAIVLAIVAAAHAQTEPHAVLIQVDRPVLEPGESAAITISADFDSDADWAMSGMLLDFVSSRGSEGIAYFEGMVPWDASGVPIGHICDRGICGFIAGMLQFPAAGIYAVPTDPIAAFEVRFVAPDITEPTEVAFTSETSRFLVYPERETSVAVSRLDELTEGRATILVVPCRADFDLDGELNIFDFLAFQNAFVAGDAMADFDFDGELTLFDFLAFQNRFDQGC